MIITYISLIVSHSAVSNFNLWPFFYRTPCTIFYINKNYFLASINESKSFSNYWSNSLIFTKNSISFSKYCNESNPRVIKTIRLHKLNLDPWILDSDIKVIHLIRDPRAVYASMAQKPKTWKGSLENVDGMCKRMLGDVLLGSKLPSDRWDKIR